MSSSGHQARKLVLVLWAGTFLAASSSYAADSPTGKNAPKPVTPAPAVSTRSPGTHPLAKKSATPATAYHSATHRRTVAHSGATRYATSKTATHASPAYAAKSTAKHTTGSASQRQGSTGRNRYKANQRYRAPTAQQRLARLHLQPERVQEIQRALIHEGYLQGDPSGQWDTSTRDAMVRYQTMNGFPATGLPEAKSLMKLGLGSHPLPAELDHGTVAAAAPSPTQSVFTVTPIAPTPAPAGPPSPEVSPPQNR